MGGGWGGACETGGDADAVVASGRRHRQDPLRAMKGVGPDVARGWGRRLTAAIAPPTKHDKAVVGGWRATTTPTCGGEAETVGGGGLGVEGDDRCSGGCAAGAGEWCQVGAKSWGSPTLISNNFSFVPLQAVRYTFSARNLLGAAGAAPASAAAIPPQAAVATNDTAVQPRAVLVVVTGPHSGDLHPPASLKAHL